MNRCITGRPTAKDRVNQLHDPIHWLRVVAQEHVFELPQQRSSLLELWRVVDTPYAPTTAHPAEIETQEAEAFVNPFAAVPSLLFGWSLLLGVVIVWVSRHPLSYAFAFAWPAAMFCAIAGTASIMISTWPPSTLARASPELR